MTICMRNVVSAIGNNQEQDLHRWTSSWIKTLGKYGGLLDDLGIQQRKSLLWKAAQKDSGRRGFGWFVWLMLGTVEYTMQWAVLHCIPIVS